MDAIKICVVVLVHTLVVEAQLAYPDDGCTTPDRSPGTCITIYSCKPMMDILEAAPQPLPAKFSNLLKKYQCGFEKRNPKVCCPSKPIVLEGVRPSEPPDVSRHRNIRLIPQDCGKVDTGDKIVGGQKADLFEFPWMTLLSYNTTRGPKFRCGATIINERYILTAAHCITSLSDPLIGVRVGEYNLSTKTDCVTKRDGERICSPPFQDLAIEKIIPHPGYSRREFSNDIGLLRVTRMDLSQENIRPVCLPLESARKYNYTNRNCEVTGWGVTETEQQSQVLMKAQVPVVSNEQCVSIYKSKNVQATITHRHLCAGGDKKSDTCGGDSGGPLHVVTNLFADTRLIQQGIVSFGPTRCGKEDLPGVYTRVAYYMDWILDNMRP